MQMCLEENALRFGPCRYVWGKMRCVSAHADVFGTKVPSRCGNMGTPYQSGVKKKQSDKLFSRRIRFRKQAAGLFVHLLQHFGRFYPPVKVALCPMVFLRNQILQ